MPRSFTEQVVREGTVTMKDWIKSQIILTTITLVGLLVGMNLIGIEHWILASVAITFIDLLPVLGLSVTMIPWAFYKMVFADDTRTGLWIFFLFLIIMALKQILDPFVRAFSLGISPWEEIIASLAGFVLLGMNGIGLILGPVVYIVGKKVYRTMNPLSEVGDKQSTGYFDRGFGQRPEKPKEDPTAGAIDITDDVVEVTEEETSQT
ncbi:MAG: AI-2E family transporter [Clostridia bacterium]|nr:AI-2E family transporter [Clostridia bacterium]